MIPDEPTPQAVLIGGHIGVAPRFPDRLQLPLTFDRDLLVRDLDHVSASGWIRHAVKQNYDGDWSVIPLRCAAGATHPLRMIYPDPTARSFVDTALLQGCDYFRHVLDAFRCPMRTVRLMRLAPGSAIKEHTDLDLSFEAGTVRIHIAVTSNDGVEFYLNKSRIVMAAGDAWYLRLTDPHSVVNRGSVDRVHLVIDANVNAWLEALFESALPQAS